MSYSTSISIWIYFYMYKCIMWFLETIFKKIFVRYVASYTSALKNKKQKRFAKKISVFER